MSRQYLSTFRKQPNQNDTAERKRNKSCIFLHNKASQLSRKTTDSRNLIVVTETSRERTKVEKETAKFALENGKVQLDILEKALADLRLRERKALRELENEMRKYRKSTQNSLSLKRQKTNFTRYKWETIFPTTLNEEEVVLKRVGKAEPDLASQPFQTSSSALSDAEEETTSDEEDEKNIMLCKNEDKIIASLTREFRPKSALKRGGSRKATVENNDLRSKQDNSPRQSQDHIQFIEAFSKGRKPQIEENVNERIDINQTKNSFETSDNKLKMKSKKAIKTLRFKDNATQLEHHFIEESTRNDGEKPSKEIWPSWSSPNNKKVQTDLKYKMIAHGTDLRKQLVDDDCPRLAIENKPLRSSTDEVKNHVQLHTEAVEDANKPPLYATNGELLAWLLPKNCPGDSEEDQRDDAFPKSNLYAKNVFLTSCANSTSNRHESCRPGTKTNEQICCENLKLEHFGHSNKANEQAPVHLNTEAPVCRCNSISPPKYQKFQEYGTLLYSDNDDEFKRNDIENLDRTLCKCVSHVLSRERCKRNILRNQRHCGSNCDRPLTCSNSRSTVCSRLENSFENRDHKKVTTGRLKTADIDYGLKYLSLHRCKTVAKIPEIMTSSEQSYSSESANDQWNCDGMPLCVPTVLSPLYCIKGRRHKSAEILPLIYSPSSHFCSLDSVPDISSFIPLVPDISSFVPLESNTSSFGKIKPLKTEQSSENVSSKTSNNLKIKSSFSHTIDSAEKETLKPSKFYSENNPSSRGVRKTLSNFNSNEPLSRWKNMSDLKANKTRWGGRTFSGKSRNFNSSNIKKCTTDNTPKSLFPRCAYFSNESVSEERPDKRIKSFKSFTLINDSSNCKFKEKNTEILPDKASFISSRDNITLPSANFSSGKRGISVLPTESKTPEKKVRYRLPMTDLYGQNENHSTENDKNQSLATFSDKKLHVKEEPSPKNPQVKPLFVIGSPALSNKDQEDFDESFQKLADDTRNGPCSTERVRSCTSRQSLPPRFSSKFQESNRKIFRKLIGRSKPNF